MLNPGTPVDALAYVLDLVDLVLVMSVNPGFGGQTFIRIPLAKIAEIRAHDRAGRDIVVEVDGGITPAMPGDRAAGADVLVCRLVGLHGRCRRLQGQYRER